MNKPSVIYQEEPFIARYDNVLSSSECHELIEIAQNQLQPATVVGKTEVITSEFRKSEFAWFQHHSSEVVRQVSERVAAIVGQPLHFAEQLQIARYGVGGKFGAHFDTYELTSVVGKKFYDEGGQRIYTALLYLNTVEAGGETYFPELNLDIAPLEGTLLVFENCKKGTNERHPLSLHGSRELKAGEKWIATLWFRERPQYQPPQKAITQVEQPISPIHAMPSDTEGTDNIALKSLQEILAETGQAHTTGRDTAKEKDQESIQAKVIAMGSSGKREIQMRHYQVTTDIVPEAEKYVQGPSPSEMMLGALGSCIAQMGLSLAAARGITLQYLEVEVTGHLTSADRWSPPSLHNISYKLIILSPNVTEDILKLHNAIERTCPSLQLLVDPQQIKGTISHIKANG